MTIATVLTVGLTALPDVARAQAAVSLTWDRPAAVRVASYMVEWGPAPGTYVAAASVPGDVTSFEVPGLRPGLRYYFVVRAVDAGGQRSAPSNEVTAVADDEDASPFAGVHTAAGEAWPDVTLAVQHVGAGSGTVASSPAGIDCGASCALSLPRGTRVVLSAEAAPGSRFIGWEGAGCAGDGTCAIDLGEPMTVAAVFADGGDTTASFTRYLAEGAVSGLFETRIALANPGARTAMASLRFLREDGIVLTHSLELAPLSSTRLDAKQVPGLLGKAFATTIESDTALVVDRTMSWRGPDGIARGAHAEASVAGPAPRWYLAEGATSGGFDLFYLLENPHDREVLARIRYLRPNAGPLEKVYRLPPLSRVNVWVDHEVFDASGAQPLAACEVSAIIDVIDGPGIVVERAMYDSQRGATFRAGHGSAAVTATAERWYFAEGATGPYFDMFLLIANPGHETADIVVTYLLPDGTRERRRHRVGPLQRYTIWVDWEGALLADTAVSAIVESTNGVPIVAERSMWWPGDSRTWIEAHNSPGATVEGTRWAVADGDVSRASPSRSTYLLVANPSARDARVRVTLLFRAGVPAIAREFTVLAGSRFGASVGDAFPEAVGHRFGVLVESLGDQPVPIVVERAMYADAPGQPWASGTSVLATRLR